MGKHGRVFENRRNFTLFAFSSIGLVLLFFVDLAVGPVSISVRDVWAALSGGECPESTVKIVKNIRLIKAVTAFLVGVSLSVSGLLMQTLFRNPLAGPYVLGVSSGASMGVALLILGAPLLGINGNSFFSVFGIAGAACIGAALILFIVAAVSRKIKDVMVILIIGMMLGSGVSAVVQILQYLSNETALKTFVIWTMGSLGDVTPPQIFLLSISVATGMVLAVAVIKSLNLLLIGEDYAKTMGLNVNKSRQLIFLSTILLAGTSTAFCGPIGFIGLAVPHVARSILKNADHRVLLPFTALTGALMLLLCDIISKFLALPINSITALMGIPIVIWVVVQNKNIV